MNHVRPADPASFSTFRVGRLSHDFHRHPLMQLPALARLAHDLAPTGQCRFIPPGTRQDSAFNHKPAAPDGRDIDEVFRRMEEPGSWVALYNVETDALYRGFLDEVIESVRPVIEREQPGIRASRGFIFISAPPSVTPFHIDRENNFWLQVQGRKLLNVWEPTDRVAVAAADVDEFIVYGSLENVRMKEGDLERAHTFDVGPGEGVYFPSTSPHTTRSERDWTRPGDGVSVSIGVVFYTDHTRRSAYAHAWNRFLRGIGFEPRAVGGNATADAVKHAFGRVLVAAKRVLRGYQPKDGF
jgi:hypothetical protein